MTSGSTIFNSNSNIYDVETKTFNSNSYVYSVVTFNSNSHIWNEEIATFNSNSRIITKASIEDEYAVPWEAHPTMRNTDTTPQSGGKKRRGFRIF